MRTITIMLSALLLGTAAAHAQAVVSFENFTLSTADTFYLNTNFATAETDQGFSAPVFGTSSVHFPYVFDSSFNGFWSYGFAFSNMTDDTDQSFPNIYSSITGSGYNSPNYAVANCGLNYFTSGQDYVIVHDTAATDSVKGFYITNTAYAYGSMHNGDGFTPKFGDSTSTDTTHVNPDWCKVTMRGYLNGASVADSIDYYLADYRFADSASDYIVNSWQWVDLSSFGHVDSIAFEMSSSKVSSFGMLTPAFFCIDNMTFSNPTTAVKNVPATVGGKIYPNPATNELFVEDDNNSIQHIAIYEVTGKLAGEYAMTASKLSINTSSFAPGTYLMKLDGNGNTATVRFVKQ